MLSESHKTLRCRAEPKSGAGKSTPLSLHEFDESQFTAVRIRGEAKAAPRKYEECASKGIPNRTGLPCIVMFAS